MMARASAARAAATTARADPMNSGDKPPTATRVNGTVNENAATPSRPHEQPVVGGADSAERRMRVALLFCVMNDDSSSRIAAVLRHWIAHRAARRATAVHPHAGRPAPGQPGDRPEGAARSHDTQGLIESRPGVGTFVRAVRTARPADYGWQTAALRRRSPVSGCLDRHAQRAQRRHRAARGLPRPRAAARAPRAVGPDPSGARRHRPVASTGSGAAGAAVVVRARARHRQPGRRHATHGRATSSCCPGSQSGLSSIFRALVPTGQPLLMESPTYWGAIAAAAQAGVRVVPVPTGPDGPDPDELARAFDETGARAVLRSTDLRQPHRRAVVDRTRRGRSSTSFASTAPSSSRTTGRTTSASPPRPPRRRTRRRRPRRLPPLAHQERVPGPPHRRRHRPRPSPRTHPRRPRSRVDVRQRPAPDSRPRRRDPARVADPPAQPAPTACGTPRPAPRHPSSNMPPKPTSSMCPRGDSISGPACPTAPTSNGSPKTANVRECSSHLEPSGSPPKPPGRSSGSTTPAPTRQRSRKAHGSSERHSTARGAERRGTRRRMPAATSTAWAGTPCPVDARSAGVRRSCAPGIPICPALVAEVESSRVVCADGVRGMLAGCPGRVRSSWPRRCSRSRTSAS